MATANTARIAAVNGKPTLLVNDQPMVPMFYALTDSPGGRWTWEELPQQNLRQFAAAGVRLFQVDLFYELIYTEDNTLKLDVVCRQLRGVLDACPDAGIVIRLHMNPLPSWIAAHPEEWTRYADTAVKAKTYPGLYRPLADDLEPVPRASLASVAWRDDATYKLREVLFVLKAGLTQVRMHVNKTGRYQESLCIDYKGAVSVCLFRLAGIRAHPYAGNPAVVDDDIPVAVVFTSRINDIPVFQDYFHIILFRYPNHLVTLLIPRLLCRLRLCGPLCSRAARSGCSFQHNRA